jgi:phosphoribosylanthranilate isomerase
LTRAKFFQPFIQVKGTHRAPALAVREPQISIVAALLFVFPQPFHAPAAATAFPPMIGGIRIKVCGLTTLVDAEAADAAGADYLGFIFYPKSPRYVSLAQWRAMAPRLPARKKVAVSVAPTIDDLREWAEAGFDAFQIHFPVATPTAMIGKWAEVVGADRLWIAPKMPPGSEFPPELLLHARTVLWDTYSADGYGGTGRTGDWKRFRRMREEHPATTWVLAGGLTAANVRHALATTGARMLDVNSGVEAAPGIKDAAKLQAFTAAIRGEESPA